MSGSGHPDCLFCRIVAGEVPADKVAETDTALAFRDIRPVGPTHILVIPKTHLDDAAALGPDDGDLLADLFSLARSVALAEGISGSGYRLVMNVGEDSGNTVAHLHLHVIGGRALSWPPG